MVRATTAECAAELRRRGDLEQRRPRACEPREGRRRCPALLPLSVDVGQARLPWANWVLIAVTVVVFFATTSFGSLDPREPSVLMLDGAGIGVLGYVLLHADVVHLLGNMVFLWVFGNAVCARGGSFGYLACYACFAVTTALAHLALSDRPAVVASGAINGVVGMFVVFHPKDYVRFAVVDLGSPARAPCLGPRRHLVAAGPAGPARRGRRRRLRGAPRRVLRRLPRRGVPAEERARDGSSGCDPARPVLATVTCVRRAARPPAGRRSPYSDARHATTCSLSGNFLGHG